jgi:hypothetical protein
MLPKEMNVMQRRHRVAYASLLVATLLPMVAGITAFGTLLKRMFPSPDSLHIAAGAFAFILLVPVLMCLGALCWLLAVRRIVPRSTAEAFFVHGGFGVLSRVGEWMFKQVYGDSDQEGA